MSERNSTRDKGGNSFNSLPVPACLGKLYFDTGLDFTTMDWAGQEY